MAGESSGPDWGDAADKLRGATGADRLILIAGVLFFIDSFLPWYGIGFGGFNVNIKGWSSGGLAVIAILLAIAATVFAAARVVGWKQPIGTLKDGVVYLALGVGAFAFTLLRWITETSLTKYGLYIALVLGAALAYGGWQKYQKPV